MKTSTDLNREEWGRALAVLDWLPNQDQLLESPSRLYADFLYTEMEQLGIEKDWEFTPYPFPVADFVCQTLGEAGSPVYVMNDFIHWEIEKGPFVVSIADLRDWIDQYPERVTPVFTVMDGDLILWTESRILCINEDDRYLVLDRPDREKPT